MGGVSTRMGGVTGVVAAVALAAGLAIMPRPPGAEAEPQTVFAYFLDERGEVRAAGTLIALSLLGTAGLLSTMRVLLARRGARVFAAAMLAFGLLALGAAALAAAILTALAIGAEDADPATSRALLDLADVAVGISGPGFSLALIACAFGALKVPGTLPAPLVPLSLLTAAATLLWAGRLLSDGDALAAGSFAGSALGWLLLLIWIGANGLWLARRRSPDYRTPIQ